MLKIANLIIALVGASALCAWELPKLDSISEALSGVVPHGDKVKSAFTIGKAAAKAAEDITPEQEYYIGRAVSATILSKYKLYKNAQLTDYVSKVGVVLSLCSKTPYTFGGYSFAILDSEEINAFAAPSGMVFVTRGMVRLCDSEDALAAVLAHEIAHVQNRHGIRSIEKGRMTSLLSTVAGEGIKQYGNKNIGKLTTMFEGSINDIVNTMVTSGYSRAYEYEADKDAIEILKKAGYRTDKIVSMLENMKQGLKAHSGGFGSTHPNPQDRIDELKSSIGEAQELIPDVRTSRFGAEIKKL